MEFFLGEGRWVFSAALVVVLGIGVLEALALSLGASLSSSIDGISGDAPDAGGLAWLHVGRLPLLVVLVLLLSWFALLGLGLQSIVAAIFGESLPLIAATPLALIGALPATRVSGSALARILPRDESTAISSTSFVGRSATLVSGVARAGHAAEARFQDEFGQTHYVMVEPASQAAPLHGGERVLLLRELGAGRYQAAANPIVD